MVVRAQRAGRAHVSMRGFTLVELLVVVTLLSIIMLALGGVLRAASQVDTRVLERQRQMDDLRQITHFLTHAVGHVSGRRVVAAQNPGGEGVLFRAQADSLQWVGLMPARHGAGGRTWFRLSPEPTDQGGAALVLRYKEWQVTDSTFPNWTNTSRVVLLSQVSSFQVRAEGQPKRGALGVANWPEGWQSGWPLATQLPDRVELSIQIGEKSWPVLVISLYPGGLQKGASSAQVGGM